MAGPHKGTEPLNFTFAQENSMSTSGKRMMTMAQAAVRILAVLLAAALPWPPPFARAQAAPGGSPGRSSVLSTGVAGR